MSRSAGKRINSTPGARIRPGVRGGAAVISKGRDRVERILGVARKIIVLEGYSRFTMRRVAAAAGISLGNLQYYFIDKSALIRELVVDLNELPDRHAVAAPDDDRPGGGERQFLALIDAMFEDQRLPLFRGLLLQFWALSCNDPSVARSMEVAHSQYGRAIGAAIRRVNANLDESAVAQRSQVIRSLVDGTLFAFLNKDGVLCLPPGLYKRVRREALRVAKRAPARVRSSRASSNQTGEPADES